ncbi:MAG TPA: amino acid ABC transporter permease [Candidatus Saccharimonadales bacterium]|nr:amino acid ABC transporter permease [Candidatus Saccharimonadales bacterium]
MSWPVAVYQYDWSIFFRSIFQPDGLILGGLALTVSIAVVSQFIGVVLGTFAALGRMARAWPLRVISRFYIWFFRGTPLLVQLSFIYFGLGVAGIYRWPDFVVPGTGFTINGAWQAGIVALGLNEGAYMSEIVRAGILSIDRGQMEAAKSLGMTYRLGMRRIVLPQAARVIVPPLGNEFNNMLKTTSLLIVIGVLELYGVFSAKNGSGDTSFHPFELFLAAAVWYLLLTTIWGVVQGRLERHFGRGTDTESDALGLRARLIGRRAPVTGGPPVTGGR